MAFDFEQLTRTKLVDGRDHVLVRPGLVLVLYCNVPIPSIGPHIANAIDAYLSVIHPNTLQTYFAENGTYRNLTSARITKDLKALRKLPNDLEYFFLEYSQGINGEVGTHAILFDGNPFDDETLPLETNLLRLEFPYNLLDNLDLETFVEFILMIAKLVPFQSGNAGYSLKRSQLFMPASTQQINQLLPRYLAFDPSFDDAREEMRGCTPSAHWINLLDSDLVEKIGGIKAIEKALPSADIRQLENGILIRVAMLPPIGDINRNAKDIGCLPDLARLMRPTRFEVEGFGQPADVFDAMTWLARYDEMKSQKWDNS